MVNDAQKHINEITNKARISYLDISNRDLAGETNLTDLTNLKNLNASNNKFTNLDFLLTLPNKNKLESINFFGNEIKEIDLTVLLTNFPNLKKVNLDNNPLSLKNLDKLSLEKWNFLVENVDNKKIKLSSWKGSVVVDLLKQIQKLKSQLSGIGTTQQREILLQKQNIPNKSSSKFGLLILAITSFLLIGLLYLYYKKKETENKKC